MVREYATGGGLVSDLRSSFPRARVGGEELLKVTRCGDFHHGCRMLNSASTCLGTWQPASPRPRTKRLRRPGETDRVPYRDAVSVVSPRPAAVVSAWVRLVSSAVLWGFRRVGMVPSRLG